MECLRRRHAGQRVRSEFAATGVASGKHSRGNGTPGQPEAAKARARMQPLHLADAIVQAPERDAPGASPSTCATSSVSCDGSRDGAGAANSARGASPFLADAASACAHEARPWPRPSMLASGGARCSLHVRLDESSGRGERTDHDVHRRSAPRSSAEAWDIRGLRRPRPAPAPPQPAPRRSRGHRARRTRARARRGPPRRPAKSPRPWTVHVTSDRPRPFVVIRVRRKTVSEIDAPAIENVAAGGDRDEHRRIAMLGDADGRGSLRSCSRHPVLLGR